MMSRKILSGILCAVLLLVCAAPAYAFDVPEYKFEGAKNDELYDTSGVVTADMGAQVILPDDSRNEILPYGVTIIGPSYAGSSGGGQSSSGGLVIGADGYPDVWGGQTGSAQTGFYEPTTIYTPTYSDPDAAMATLKQKDGSLGSLSIPAIKVSAKLYENDMSKGIGHIPGTAFWNGNVCIMGHNRGSNPQFGKIKDLKIGDVITYTTNQGTRNYTVTFNGAISATDWTMLQPTADNRLTLITCIANTPSLRQCLQAVEIR
jgi:LPXTG-site transpeptidase (sortase) family protein